MRRLHPVLTGCLVAVAVSGSLAACSSSGAAHHTTAPTGQGSSASAAVPGTTATSAASGASGDQSGKYAALLDLIGSGNVQRPKPGSVTRYDSKGNVSATGPLEVSLDANKSAACLTDTHTNVSLQLKTSDRHHLYVYTSPRCTGLLGSVAEQGGSGSAKAEGNDPTLKGIAAKINALDAQH